MEVQRALHLFRDSQTEPFTKVADSQAPWNASRAKNFSNKGSSPKNDVQVLGDRENVESLPLVWDSERADGDV